MSDYNFILQKTKKGISKNEAIKAYCLFTHGLRQASNKLKDIEKIFSIPNSRYTIHLSQLRSNIPKKYQNKDITFISRVIKWEKWQVKD